MIKTDFIKQVLSNPKRVSIYVFGTGGIDYYYADQENVYSKFSHLFSPLKIQMTKHLLDVCNDKLFLLAMPRILINTNTIEIRLNKDLCKIENVYSKTVSIVIFFERQEVVTRYYNKFPIVTEHHMHFDYLDETNYKELIDQIINYNQLNKFLNGV